MIENLNYTLINQIIKAKIRVFQPKESNTCIHNPSNKMANIEKFMTINLIYVHHIVSRLFM